MKSDAWISLSKSVDLSWVLFLLAMGSGWIYMEMKNEKNIETVAMSVLLEDYERIKTELMQIEESWDQRYGKDSKPRLHDISEWSEVMELPLIGLKVSPYHKGGHSQVMDIIERLKQSIYADNLDFKIPISYLSLRDLMIWVFEQELLRLSFIGAHDTYDGERFSPLIMLKFEIPIADETRVIVADLIKRTVPIGSVDVFTINRKTQKDASSLKGLEIDEFGFIQVSFSVQTHSQSYKA